MTKESYEQARKLQASLYALEKLQRVLDKRGNWPLEIACDTFNGRYHADTRELDKDRELRLTEVLTKEIEKMREEALKEFQEL